MYVLFLKSCVRQDRIVLFILKVSSTMHDLFVSFLLKNAFTKVFSFADIFTLIINNCFIFFLL